VWAKATRSTLAVTASAALAVVGLLGAVAQGAPDHAAKAPAGSRGQLTAIVAVPHSSDLWALGELGHPGGRITYFAQWRHHGHWRHEATPKVSGQEGVLSSIGAASAKDVWIGGTTTQAKTGQGIPHIWRWTGKKFVAQKLPPEFAGGTTVSSIAASSTKNAWAVGEMSPPNDAGFTVLHWNGVKWSAVPTPINLTTVTTVSSTDAWATGADGNLYHWNGATWSADGAAPSGSSLVAVAMSSPTRVYATGYDSDGYSMFIMRFNGTTWSSATFAKGTSHYGEPRAIAIHGTSAWIIGLRINPKTYASSPSALQTTGGAWHSEKTGITHGDTVVAVAAASSKRAYAVGYHESSTSAITFVDEFNGHKWKGVSSKT
jgi:hypothetical protein